MRAVGLLLLGALLGIALAGAVIVKLRLDSRAADLEERLNGYPSPYPRWVMDTQPCLPPTQQQLAHDRVMSEVAAAFNDNPDSTGFASSGVYYPIHYFGWEWRIIGPSRRCPPAPEYYGALASLITQQPWPEMQVNGTDLDLVRRLPPGKVLAGRLSALAFSAYPLFNSPLKQDNRPYARMLLGEQGRFALPWKDRALAAIGGETRLGTSAAYLAISIAPGEALPRVAAELRRFTAVARARKLHRVELGRAQDAFTVRDGDRLLELAFAMSAAGPDAEPWSASVSDLLDDLFARPAPPFGLLFLPEKRLCLIAEHIGGRAATIARAKPFCAGARFWSDPVSSREPTR